MSVWGGVCGQDVEDEKIAVSGASWLTFCSWKIGKPPIDTPSACGGSGEKSELHKLAVLVSIRLGGRSNSRRRTISYLSLLRLRIRTTSPRSLTF